ncbi:Nif3-like dinuclear metal center hexameric protein [Cutibacterium sp. WCA-380-WT-3A]|uniref:GTP cyclohydrolase 1 type 2 homolog n=1 Tax=Cutibacterium porci TaxID=2605781 RepID=A0A7K0J9J3_9ACTN|nr:Nif3-like dinuclear metal center hexameric protein [Cutibacterium porci]MSS46639.1 Nif3-like dinuclear metal center hexameric protein [Cutibacterium porci]
MADHSPQTPHTPHSRLITVGQVRTILDRWYPPSLAESWDAPGLVCGDPGDAVERIVCALEATDAVVDAAIEADADMLVVHHPLLMRGATSVAADTPKGRIVHRLIRHRIALMSAHTNADAAVGGVNDVLARVVGVTVERPLEPRVQPVDLWGVQVPINSVATVRHALFEAGAGRFDGYDQCSFETVGRGQFRPLDRSHPTLGTTNHVETVKEVRIHVVAPTSARSAVRHALVHAHPYEVPAYDVTTIDSACQPGPATPGIGRVGHLETPMTLRSFTQRVDERLPRTVWGVRAAGDPDQLVRTIALCSGAGDSLLDAAAASGADVYLTSDLRHHPADEHLRAGGPALVDTAHWASESPWCADVARRLHEELGLPCQNLGIRTDPWTIGAAMAQ